MTNKEITTGNVFCFTHKHNRRYRSYCNSGVSIKGDVTLYNGQIVMVVSDCIDSDYDCLLLSPSGLIVLRIQYFNDYVRHGLFTKI